jgi:hypothetical protein
MAMREMATPSLLLALDYLELLAEVRAEKLELAALRWHVRFESESLVTLAESQLALAALASFSAGDKGALEILRSLLARVLTDALSSDLKPHGSLPEKGQTGGQRKNTHSLRKCEDTNRRNGGMH